MEFNQAGGDDWNKTAQELFENKYQRHGYNMPKIVYWNMASRNKNIPVKFGEDGTAMISGFSPSILKSILSGDNISPLKIMNNTINSSRYEAITV